MPEELFVHRIREVVARHAARPAVVVDGRVVYDYRQLWQIAGNLGGRLRELGLGRESVVGIHLPRSAELIAAVLGIWRAGAAYVPLAPSLPDSRLRFMIADAGVRAIISQATSATYPPAIPILQADHELLQTARRCEPAPPALGDLAYVIYTSGTTGQPKGVAVEQRGLVALLDAQIAAFQLRPESQILFLLSPSFDASISDLGTALLSGAAICIESPAPGAESLSVVPHALIQTLRDRGITHVDLPPAVLSRLDPGVSLPDLKTIVIGGETCPAEVVQTWSRRHRVVNVYGPTEATVCTSLCVCQPDTWDRPLIGQPIDGVQYRIFPAGDGNCEHPSNFGELLISGQCLARGYLNQDELTKRRFPTIDGRRWYRTGDLVCQESDGEYRFVGRVDRQIKLRGHRIEPEEIETALCTLPRVERCAVVARSVLPDSDRKILVAFVAVADSADAPPLEPNYLRAHLERLLPEWMIPQRIELLKHFPFTAAGKVDLQRLMTMPLAGRFAPEQPLSELEQRMLNVWRKVLGITCRADDDFFEMGGDSMAAMEVVAVAKARGIDLEPGQLAIGRTVSRVCALLDQESSDHASLAKSADVLRQDILSDAIALRAQLAGQRGNTFAIDPSTDDSILLTGATGYLGSRVLEQLVRSGRQVVCLIRARDQASGERRLSETIQRQQLGFSAADLSRVMVMTGDVGAPGCGLHQETWSRLTESIGEVFHCAARVHLIDSYEAMRSANVHGLVEMMRICLSGRPKPLNYASTLSVFVGTDHCRGRLLESDDLSRAKFVYGGYAQSKWAAEALLHESTMVEGRCRIFRFGLLAIDARTGVAPDLDLLTLAVRGLVQLGCVPRDVPDLYIDLTPVDFAAKAMVQLAKAAAARGNRACVYHVANPPSVSLRRLIRGLRQLRPELRELTPEEFVTRVEQSPNARNAAACLGLCRWLSAKEQFHGRSPLDLFQATGVEFDISNTTNGLAGSGIHCSRADDPFLNLFLRKILDR